MGDDQEEIERLEAEERRIADEIRELSVQETMPSATYLNELAERAEQIRQRLDELREQS